MKFSLATALLFTSLALASPAPAPAPAVNALADLMIARDPSPNAEPAPQPAADAEEMEAMPKFLNLPRSPKKSKPKNISNNSTKNSGANDFLRPYLLLEMGAVAAGVIVVM